MKSIKGLHTALITPFTSNDQLDEDGLRQNIKFQLRAGIDGLVLLGTTGETPTLTSNEKERILKIVSEENHLKVPITVGTGSYSTVQTIENCLLAEDLGADFAMIVTPYYNKPTQEGIYQHFKKIAEATTLPIIVYNISGRTGQNIQTDTLRRLADLPLIVGVKEASGSITQMTDVISMIMNDRKDFSVLSGDDVLTLPLIALGGHGVISVVSNLIPSKVKSLVDAALSGNFEMARKLHYELLPLFKGAFIETNPIPIKKAMDLQGMAAGKCRLPLCDLTKENESRLKNILLEYTTHCF